MAQTSIEYKENLIFFLSETDRILKIIRDNGTRFNIYQTQDGSRNACIFEQEIKIIVTDNISVPNKLLNQYPLPYIWANTIADMIKSRILSEPETFIAD